MTEEEVLALAEEVEKTDTPLDASIERAWLNGEIERLQVEEQRNIYAFRIHKKMLKFDAMKQNAANLEETRKFLKLMRQQLASLGRTTGTIQ
jgi:hypothetical protein